MNNADILAMLGGAGIPGAGSSRREEEGKNILTFKAGKMDPVLQPNGKYLITADRRRGQVSLLFTLPTPTRAGVLKFEWKDRRTQTAESFTIIPEDRCTFAPIPTGREGERVYLLQFGSSSDRRFFFWMQDKFEPGVDDKNCIDMNKFLSDVNACIVAAGGEPPVQESTSSSDAPTPTASSNTPTTATATATATSTTPPSTSSTEQQQVDALSNILENLGMPQPSTTTSSTTQPATSSSTTSAPTTTPSANTSTGGVLTLADLQGAMAGLATHSPINTATPTGGQHPTPPLTELANSDSIQESGILDNPDVVARLMEFLPENQRTEEMLRENLRSPQVQQALHSLTMALAGQEDGTMESYHSIIANFQLNAEDGAAAMASGNPIQAFLDCLLASVKRDKEKEEESKE